MEEFLKLAAEVFHVEPDQLTLDTAYESLPEWDSITHITLIMEFEAAYGVSIPFDAVPDISTLRQLYAYKEKTE